MTLARRESDLHPEFFALRLFGNTQQSDFKSRKRTYVGFVDVARLTVNVRVMSSVCLMNVNGDDQKRLEIRRPDATLAQGPTSDLLLILHRRMPPLRNLHAEHIDERRRGVNGDAPCFVPLR
jgi:hypothetical protein